MITITVDPASKIPMYRQIYEYIKKEILTGTLSHPEKLPSSRSLSSYLGVSRSTVDTAYEQLVAEGYVEARQKRGYFVMPLTHMQKFSTVAGTDPADTTAGTAKRPDSIRPDLIDFDPDTIDSAHFPYTIWRSIGKNELDNPENFLMGEHFGEYSLRTAIAGYLHGSRGVVCAPENIIVGAGLDHLLQMLCLLPDRGSAIAMEDPGYLSARQVIKSAGLTVLDIPLKDNIFDVDALSDTGAGICYVTPSHQFPMGTVMGIGTRQKLLTWASAKTGRFIIEDDHDSEFRYRGRPIPALQSLDDSQCVIYIGSLSKAISPAIRTGYMVLPDTLLEKYRQVCGYYACPVSRVSQAILTTFIRDGYFEKHLNRMRKIYKQKHDHMVELLHMHFPAGRIRISGDDAGLYVILEYLGKQTEENIKKRADEHAVRLHSLSNYYSSLPAGYKPSYLLGFANLSDEQMEKGIKLLAEKILS